MPVAGAAATTVLAPAAPPRGQVLFVYGPGRLRPVNHDLSVAEYLAATGYLSTCVDLCPPGSDEAEGDVGRLARRLTAAVDRAAGGHSLPLGLVADGVAAAAALVAAVERPDRVRAVVSRRGRPDLAGATLADVTVPALLLLGGQDGPLVPANKQALAVLGAPSQLVVLTWVRHLFLEPAGQRDVAGRARDWFDRHLAQPVSGAPTAAAPRLPRT